MERKVWMLLLPPLARLFDSTSLVRSAASIPTVLSRILGSLSAPGLMRINLDYCDGVSFLFDFYEMFQRARCTMYLLGNPQQGVGTWLGIFKGGLEATRVCIAV